MSSSGRRDNPNSVDVVFHVNLLHEIRDFGLFHAQIIRVLKPRGRLFCVDWRARETGGGPPIDHRVAEDMAIEKIKEAGFADVSVKDIYEDHYLISAHSL